jgi:hypothetical protein
MKRKAVSLSSSLERGLKMYALAASAAGVGMLAWAQPAEGRIVYTPTHQVIKPNGHYNLDLNNDGIIDFLIQNKFSCGQTASCLGRAYAGAASSSRRNSVVALMVATEIRDLALQKGARIRANRIFYGGGTMAGAALSRQGTLSSWGAWANVTNRYLGLKFRFNHELHFGWARLNVKIDSKTAKITSVLTGYAYETIPNKPIIAGQTHGENDATLGRLAQGAAVVSRQKK